MSSPYELPIAPPQSNEPLDDVEAPSSRAPLRVVPDPETPVTPIDFDDFVRRHTPRLRRLVMRKLGDPSEAEEIAQETLLRAHQHRHTLATEDELIAWTTVVGQRLAIDRIRVRGRSVAVAEVPEDSRLGRDTADIVVARAEARTALEALEAIPERQAAILWAREVEGLHYDAIAGRFGISEPAVRSLLHRGRRALRKEYAVRGGTLPLRGLVPLAPGLMALRGLNRLRSAARETLKANVPVVATMSVAAALALGMSVGGGIGMPRGHAPSIPLGEGRITAQTFNESLTPAGQIRAVDRALNPAAYDIGPGQPSSGRLIYDAVTPTCVSAVGGTECVKENEIRGDRLWIGPALPSNKVVDRVSVGQSLIGVCEHLVATPVTECTKGKTDRQLPQPHRRPSRVETPNIGAQS